MAHEFAAQPDTEALSRGMRDGRAKLPAGSYKFLNFQQTRAYREAEANRDAAEDAETYWYSVGVMIGLGEKS